ncbi:hypothetical protein QWY84_16850 [Aquisalimonas lutea]|uniref:hypothetical protein n=1 Tax=Aquisalimonas lutea TaxID=1327750 RepID=UPI0025B36001|nr:hypothetical protein [Aquisalimonas lutea]MDN3519284.1 hypothetical protein [Aquisalimonas lutea]
MRSRPPSSWIAGLVMLACAATATVAQASPPALDTQEIAYLGRLAELARADTVAAITASRVDQSGRDAERATPSGLVLVSIEGVPAFVYDRDSYYYITDRQLEFVMRCRGGGVIDFSLIVRQYPGEVDDVVPVPPGTEYELLLMPYGQDLERRLPVQWVETFPSHDVVARVSGSVRADDPFLLALRGTSNLQYSLSTADGQPLTMRDGQYLTLSGGLDLSTFRSDVAPLLEHCRTGGNDPLASLDLEALRDSQAASSEAPGATPEPLEVDLDFLPRNQQQRYKRVFEGRPRSSETPLDTVLLDHLAFHTAYWEQCAATPAGPMDFYTTPPFSRARTIGLLKDDYAAFVIAALVHAPIRAQLYEENIRPDFSLEATNRRLGEVMERLAKNWRRVFAGTGCSGAVFERFRGNMRQAFPYLEYREGGRDVLVDFGSRQFEIRLQQPLAIAAARRAGAAEVGSVNQGVFNDSYPSLVLRSIAIGDFALADRIEEEFIATASNPFGGNPDNAMTRALTALMHAEKSMRRQGNLIAAYALGRQRLLGACGEPTTHYTQERIYWSEYTNGLGQYVGGSAGSRVHNEAHVPTKFNAVIQRQNSITTSSVLSSEMGAILSKLSCESALRQQLEDNMLAYFNGHAPVHVKALPGR